MVIAARGTGLSSELGEDQPTIHDMAQVLAATR